MNEIELENCRRDPDKLPVLPAGQSAKEPIKYFWIAFYARYRGKRFGKNFCFGPDFNERSYLGMETCYEMNTADPKLPVLVREDMLQEFAELYAKCIRNGRTAIVSLNYNVVVDGLIRHGRTPETQDTFIRQAEAIA